MTFYAKNSRAEFYHLVSDDRNVTICGIPVALIIIDRPAETATLYLTSDEPLDRTLCRRCEAIKNADDSDKTTG
jgi:hypothetical protein